MRRFSLFRFAFISAIFLVLLSIPTFPGRVSAQSGDLTIGIPLPLTGILAETGHHMLAGMEFAVGEANAKGGILGRKVQIRTEDTKGEINTAAAAAEKLLTKEKVFALVGGFGSTVDFGMLQSIKSYDPLFIHAGSSTVKLEEAFGAMAGYFHVYIWDYHRQEAVAKFLSNLQPKPRTVAMLYEDGLYGKTSWDYAQKYLKDAGFQVVLAEGFKSGSPDFSGILNKAKAANPDILYWVAYSGDNIQLARQCKTLMLSPKLKLFVGSGNVRKDFGESGDDLAYVDIWSSKMKVTGLTEWVERFKKFKPNYNIVAQSAQGYAPMSILLQAIQAAGKLDKEAVIAQLEKGAFWTPFGELRFMPSEKAKHQLMNGNTLIMVQYQKDGEEVVYPLGVASARVQYPAK